MYGWGSSGASCQVALKGGARFFGASGEDQIGPEPAPHELVLRLLRSELAQLFDRFRILEIQEVCLGEKLAPLDVVGVLREKPLILRDGPGIVVLEESARRFDIEPFPRGEPRVAGNRVHRRARELAAAGGGVKVSEAVAGDGEPRRQIERQPERLLGLLVLELLEELEPAHVGLVRGDVVDGDIRGEGVHGFFGRDSNPLLRQARDTVGAAEDLFGSEVFERVGEVVRPASKVAEPRREDESARRGKKLAGDDVVDPLFRRRFVKRGVIGGGPPDRLPSRLRDRDQLLRLRQLVAH